MGVTATPKCIQATSWTHKEREELGGSDKNCFDHLSFTLALINVFYSAGKAAKGYDGLSPSKTFTITFPILLENAPLSNSLILCFLANMWKANNKIPNYQDSKLWSGQSG